MPIPIQLSGINDLSEEAAQPDAELTQVAKLTETVERLEAQLAEANAQRDAVFENMKTQAELVARLRAALEAVEWVDQACPWCDGYKHEDGHASNCARQAALNPREGEE